MIHRTPQQTRSLYRSGGLTPSIQSRQESIGGEQTELEQIRERLQVSAVPDSLPCREKEYASIYEFIVGKLTDGTGGCIYISGVPGTGEYNKIPFRMWTKGLISHRFNRQNGNRDPGNKDDTKGIKAEEIACI